MNKLTQKEIWRKEHLNNPTLPSIATNEPSDTVIYLIEYFNDKSIVLPNKVIDIGCGKGRNSIYLAEKGMQVYAIDYIDHAIEYAKQQAKSKELDNKINFIVGNIDSKWTFADNFFDLAVDCFSSIDIETEQGRKIYKAEMLRTLKPGGYALVCVVASHDEWEKELIANYPGIEKNSSIWPQNGKFQKNYDKQELLNFYQEFEIIEVREYKKKAFKLNKEFIATNFWLLLKKSS